MVTVDLALKDPHLFKLGLAVTNVTVTFAAKFGDPIALPYCYANQEYGMQKG